MRISRQQMFIEMAHIVAKRSTCFRLNVGAIVTCNNRVVSIGYNGTPPGEQHCLGNDCPGKHGCKLTIHAERNAIRYIPEGVRKYPLDMYVTDSPCIDCYTAIVRSGMFRRVFFDQPYRINDHLKDTEKLSIYRITPAGYVIRWATGDIVELDP